MKRIIALLLALILATFCVACNAPANNGNDDPKSEGVMTYAEYIAAELDDAVVIEAYVQATQSWYNDAIIVYAQDRDGAYLIYNMACSEANAALLTTGTKIKVTGYKAEYKGEIEIVDATFEFVNDGKTFVAEPVDATAWLGTDTLLAHQNEYAIFKGMEIKEITYKNGEPGDDIYVTFTKNGADYDFCVERWLTGPETAVYQAFATLQVGDIVDVTGFIYWYDGVNTHITAVAASAN